MTNPALAPDFPVAANIVTKVIDKRNFQNILKVFRRDDDFIVTKLLAGYTVHLNAAGTNIMVLKAMNGSRGYLTRHVDGLIS